MIVREMGENFVQNRHQLSQVNGRLQAKHRCRLRLVYLYTP